MRTRKGLDWTDRLRCHRAMPPRAAWTTASSMARSSRSITMARPISPRLQAALSEGRSKDLTYFVFDLLYARGRGPAAPPLTERKDALAGDF